MINLDMSKYAFTRGAIFNTLETGMASLDVVVKLQHGDDEDDDAGQSGKDAAVFDLLIQSGQYRHQAENYEIDPLSALIYPVFDTLGAEGPGDEKKKVVGVLFTTLYWRFLLSDILPPGIDGVDCVLENSVGQLYSYQINGETAEYIGPGDFHDKQYDEFKETIDIAEYMASTSRPESRSFTAVDLSDEYLQYTLRVYPSQTFEELYVTGEAATEAFVVIIIFAVVIMIFLVYDCCVRRRQRIVMDRAVKATAVVSSLYPETIREKIINDKSNDVVNSSKRNRGIGGKKRQSTFMRKNSSDLEQETRGDDQQYDGPLIASKHRNCTVFFADLVGFTKWSSTREPEQVFRLLEALFKEFDAAAHRRGVFKVETIGDCYMAVTGLPIDQSDHAVRMAKFAYDCQIKLEQVTAELVADLGEGTDDLALRIGMHSGEVTAGVLRGLKGRFQLFGDTVNTASRMESTSEPRKIQVSQATADALIADGKTSWLYPRRDKIVAKGKGEMQTYFLNIKQEKASDKSSTNNSSSLTA